MTIQFHEEIAKTMKNLAKCNLFAKQLKIMGQRLHIKFQLLFSEVVIQSLSKNKFFNK